MANLKVFVSSTCYDMHAIRAQLRSMLIGMGYEPVMSDQADVIYDPRVHTHTSCLREVSNCDALILVVGSRFGGAIVPKALELLDLDRLTDLSRAEKFGEDKTRISITQAEVLQAIQIGLPVFAFVDSAVMRDHLTYEKNKNKPIIKEIEFSSIDKSDSAPYIFEFINFLRLRNENNSIFEFSRFEDIEGQAKKQWAGLFQRLLHEQRTKAIESRRIENLSSQIADLKAAVLGSISSGELKETAKGAIRFRQMIDIVHSLAVEYRPTEATSILHSNISWDDLLVKLGIVGQVADSSNTRRIGPLMTILLREDGTYYRIRHSARGLARIGREWEDFTRIGPDAKDAILNAVLDGSDGRPTFLVRHYNEPYVGTDPLLSPDEDVDNDQTPRVLLTKERYIEGRIVSFLQEEGAFRGMSFIVDVTPAKVALSIIQADGSTKAVTFDYNTPDDGRLTEELNKLKAEIKKFLVEFRSAALPTEANSQGKSEV